MITSTNATGINQGHNPSSKEADPEPTMKRQETTHQCIFTSIETLPPPPVRLEVRANRGTKTTNHLVSAMMQINRAYP
jgi:hypothetical protein